MEQTKVATILREEAGLTNTEIDAMTQEGVDNTLAKLGYDTHGEKLPQGQTAGKGMIPVPEEFEEYTISGSAENTLNIGNYSSAKRGVFVGKKLKLPANLDSQETFKILRDETKKLQMLAEAQLSGICAEAMGPEGFNDNSWHNVATRMFVNAIGKAKLLFGFQAKPKAPAQA